MHFPPQRIGIAYVRLWFGLDLVRRPSDYLGENLWVTTGSNYLPARNLRRGTD